jgi:hypothetical protein
VSQPLTPDERATLKRAAFGAIYLISNADPGFVAMLRESAAASDALTDASGLVYDVLTTGALPKLPRNDPAKVEAVVLPALRQSLAILAAKAPAEVDAYRSTVLAAVERTAAAVHGVNEQEAAMLAKVRDALGAGDLGHAAGSA